MAGTVVDTPRVGFAYKKILQRTDRKLWNCRQDWKISCSGLLRELETEHDVDVSVHGVNSCLIGAGSQSYAFHEPLLNDLSVNKNS